MIRIIRDRDTRSWYRESMLVSEDELQRILESLEIEDVSDDESAVWEEMLINHKPEILQADYEEDYYNYRVESENVSS